MLVAERMTLNYTSLQVMKASFDQKSPKVNFNGRYTYFNGDTRTVLFTKYGSRIGMVPSIIDVWGYDREFCSSSSSNTQSIGS